eukprot:CAMPEP_0118635492 /NCGR_PEP_ID=MMETSP0785-20121206/2105_1 /TAXON_ID=91992 /ORGANISM="Bolidomonas pacifica, Strain CCMP 1866" /LENGTH=120 /DNA_ID=CAMNT_0006526529 /DNA_START=353 /DNA_END=714 /DNA_ORIENTATION=+
MKRIGKIASATWLEEHRAARNWLKKKEIKLTQEGQDEHVGQGGDVGGEAHEPVCQIHEENMGRDEEGEVDERVRGPIGGGVVGSCSPLPQEYDLEVEHHGDGLKVSGDCIQYSKVEDGDD